MSLRLFAHPLSSYSQKALTALYENATPFALELLEHGSAASAELSRLWPLQRFPVLEDAGRVIPEATVIIEYLAVHYPGPTPLVPRDPAAAIAVRLMDRCFDNYVMTPMQAIVADALRPQGSKDPFGAEQARALLDRAYAWLDAHMADRVWASGPTFTLADCAAAPALLYADWTHPIAADFPHVRAYRSRLLQRPAYARALDEARPYRRLFPLGAPTDRD